MLKPIAKSLTLMLLRDKSSATVIRQSLCMLINLSIKTNPESNGSKVKTQNDLLSVAAKKTNDVQTIKQMKTSSFKHALCNVHKTKL